MCSLIHSKYFLFERVCILKSFPQQSCAPDFKSLEGRGRNECEIVRSDISVTAYNFSS